MACFQRSTCYVAAILAAASFGCGERPALPEGAPPGGRSPPAQRAGEEAAKTALAPPEERLPRGDPRAVFLAAHRAMKGREFGTLFDLLSGEAQEKFHSRLRADAETSESAPFARDVLGFDPRECAKLPPRGAFVKVMDGGTRASEKFSVGVGSASPEIAVAKVSRVDIEDETATVTVEYETGSKSEVRLVREDGKWRLAELPWIVGAE